jgi:hypothetical protein
MVAHRGPEKTSTHLSLFFLLLAAGGCGPDGTPAEVPPPVSGMPGMPGGSTPAAPATLPMSVTGQFQNQGWFADPTLEPLFSSGMVIRQADGTTGPCAQRQTNARGKCLKVTYTPPTGYTPPAGGGWVGVFFLTTVATDHPEAMPPARAGDANWGVEPGRSVAPGATKITFLGAADQEGVPVTFKAGTGMDTFMIPDQREVLGTAWKSYTLSLGGMSYSKVIGAFAWVLTDTGKTTTFYLDSIEWQ